MNICLADYTSVPVALLPDSASKIVKWRDEASSHLTPADLSREQERARKWFEDHQAKPQVVAASGAWAQQSAPPTPDQTLTTGQLFETPKAAQCGSPPAFDEKSIAALKQQAASGNAAAQCGLGGLYEAGIGVSQDYAQAAFWYRKSAEQADSVAQVSLGYLYHEGHGVPLDYTQALAWCRKAAGQGNADAQKCLGRLYSEGQGVPQDYTQ